MSPHVSLCLVVSVLGVSPKKSDVSAGHVLPKGPSCPIVGVFAKESTNKAFHWTGPWGVSPGCFVLAVFAPESFDPQLGVHSHGRVSLEQVGHHFVCWCPFRFRYLAHGRHRKSTVTLPSRAA